MQQLIPWILGSVSVALLLAALALALMQRHHAQPRPLPTNWALAPRPVFSTDERYVYRQLREALPQHIVLSKLPLVRFCQPTDPAEARFWYELLGTIHVAFAICSASGRVLAAVDLDTERADSPRRRQIKQSMLAACRVRYLRCAVDELPSIPELQRLVPQVESAARGQQSAPAVAPIRAGAGATSRLHKRNTLRPDSASLKDSLFDPAAQSGLGAPSGLGNLRGRGGAAVRDSHAAPGDAGDTVNDKPAAPRRR
jgi:hypothetical protein